MHIEGSSMDEVIKAILFANLKVKFTQNFSLVFKNSEP